MNRREQVLRNRLDHFHALAQEAALAGNGPRSRWMAKEAHRCEQLLAAIARHPSTGRGGA